MHPIFIGLLGAKAGVLFVPARIPLIGPLAHAGRLALLRKVQESTSRVLKPAEATLVLKDIAKLRRSAKNGWASGADLSALKSVFLALSTASTQKGATAVETFFDGLKKDLRTLVVPATAKKARARA